MCVLKCIPIYMETHILKDSCYIALFCIHVMMDAYMFVFRLKRLMHQKGKCRCFWWHNRDNIPVTTTCVHAHTCTGSWPYLFILSFWLTTKILKLIFSAYEKKIRKSFVQPVLCSMSRNYFSSAESEFCNKCYSHKQMSFVFIVLMDTAGVT